MCMEAARLASRPRPRRTRRGLVLVMVMGTGIWSMNDVEIVMWMFDVGYCMSRMHCCSTLHAAPKSIVRSPGIGAALAASPLATIITIITMIYTMTITVATINVIIIIIVVIVIIIGSSSRQPIRGSGGFAQDTRSSMQACLVAFSTAHVRHN